MSIFIRTTSAAFLALCTQKSHYVYYQLKSLKRRYLLGTVSSTSVNTKYFKGVYPQSDGRLGTVDIDASKAFVDLWVHLFFAIFALFDVKRELK